MIPNEGQKELTEKIGKFLKSSERVFLITGRAGSGKTTALIWALESLLEKQKSKRGSYNYTPLVAGITTAHKAKNVLRSSIPDCYTFASAFGFVAKIKNGKQVFVPEKNLTTTPIGRCYVDVFVHDEVSMYTQSMLDLMLKQHPVFSKIILLGDPAQLPPIVEDLTIGADKDSPVFELDLPEWCRHDLKERVRQNVTNPILDLADLCIDEIENDKSRSLTRVIEKILSNGLVDGKGYKVMPYQEAMEEYVGLSDFLNNKVITYRNEKACIPINRDLRKIVMPEANELLVPGDIIFMTSNFRVFRDGEKFNIENSEDLKVESVDKIDFRFPGIDYPIECYKGYVQSNLMGQVRYVITPTELGLNSYHKALEYLKIGAIANPKLWKAFYDFKASFSEFTYAFAINSYKSQGSTYDNVYIDLMDMLSVTTLTDKRKLQSIYTSLTRAKNTVTFFKRL